MGKIALSCLGLIFFTQTILAEDLNQIFKKVNELIASKNYPKALEELGWAKKEIEKQHLNQLRSYLPDELAGFSGQKFESNSALGFTAIERTYQKSGDPAQIKVSLSGGSGGTEAAFGNLAALGKMAAMMGGEGGQETIRVAGRTATLKADEGSNSAELTVFLDSGSVLKFEMDNGSKVETLKSLAEAVKINDLDTYLKGQAQG